MPQAREANCELDLGDHYTRVLVRNSFYQVSKTLRCDARVVSGSRKPASGVEGPTPGEIGRNVHPRFFPAVNSDQLVVDLNWRGIAEDGKAGDVHLSSAEHMERLLDDVFQTMAQQVEDEAEKFTLSTCLCRDL